MTALFDVTPDYEILDGNATGQYFSAQAPSGDNYTLRRWSCAKPVTIADMNVGEIQEAEGDHSAGVYGRFDARIRIPTSEAEAAEITPKTADQIVANGHTWTVLHVGIPRFGDQWRLDCRDLELASGLTDHVDIKIPTARTTDGDASDLVRFDVLWANVAARIQAIAAAPADIHAGTLRGYTKHYAIYMSIDLDLPYNTLVVDSAAGTTYEMIGFTNRQSITDLSQIIAVIKPGA